MSVITIFILVCTLLLLGFLERLYTFCLKRFWKISSDLLARSLKDKDTQLTFWLSLLAEVHW